MLTGILIIVAIIFLYAVLLYNRIIRRKNQLFNAFSSIDVMLTKRYDLLPKLVEIVRVYMKYEKEILTEITRIRSLINADMPNDEKIYMHNKLSAELNSLRVSIENYPELKANINFLKLQGSWNEAEEQIAAARRFYNTAVTNYNNAILTFPGNVFADLFDFQEAQVFIIDSYDRITDKPLAQF